MFWGLGLWGYITSYKGISTNFVLREPSVYQNICDCHYYITRRSKLLCSSPCYAHILSKHFEIVNTQKFIKRRLFFVVIYQQLRISIVFRRFLNAK